MGNAKLARPELVPLGQAIRDARLDFRLPRSTLAAEMRLQVKTIRQIEEGSCAWLFRVRKVADYLGVELPPDF